MKKYLFTAMLALAGALCARAQKNTIESVYRISKRSSEAIKEGTEVKGYYFFYASDKIDKNTYEWTLEITDNNLKTLKSIKFQDSKHVSILESSFNGTDLIFLLYDDKANTFEYKLYGADGNKKNTYKRELTKKKRQ